MEIFKDKEIKDGVQKNESKIYRRYYRARVDENKIYEALGFESGFIRIIDDTDEDYLYEPENFVIIENEK